LPKLTAMTVTKAIKPGRFGDGEGLYLQVSRWRTKSWVFRYKRGKRDRQLGLGSTKTLSLADARERAHKARALLLDGIDPIEAKASKRTADKLAAAQSTTFKQCAEAFLSAHSDSWKNPKHRDQWKSTMERFVYPRIGDLAVASVDTGLIIKILEPIWNKRTETASRVRGRVERILDWAKVRELRTGDNPARWRGHLDKLLPSRRKVQKVKHHSALPFDEAPKFMGSLRKQTSVSGRALEFTILTAARTGETIGARWPEIDFKRAIWTVPGERTKHGRDHRVPLCDRAIKILKDMPREATDKDGFIFPGAKEKKGLSNMAMLELLKDMKPGITVHGFRSTFRDWAAERTPHPNEVVEMALAHVVEDKTEAAYRRGDLFEKRRALMDDWCDYCTAR
jgi:integrase